MESENSKNLEEYLLENKVQKEYIKGYFIKTNLFEEEQRDFGTHVVNGLDKE